jgi:DNA (cytosine-5)-methyltransferase 1
LGALLIDEDGNARPDPAKKGRTFNSFVNAMRRQGLPG